MAATHRYERLVNVLKQKWNLVVDDIHCRCSVAAIMQFSISGTC